MSMFSKFYCRAFLPLQISTWKRTSTRAPSAVISMRSCSTRNSLSRFQVKIKEVAELQSKSFTQLDKTVAECTSSFLCFLDKVLTAFRNADTAFSALENSRL